ncbi:MAG: hypothetical protein P4L84_05925 [Isosphaeraceae bacterium]|nr:hypothetical protein [Isosphaeraceae bacterium]
MLNVAPMPTRDDSWVRRAVRFHADNWKRNMRLPGSPVPRVKLDSVIAAAADLWSAPEPFKRWETEARLLANQAFVDIAARVGEPQEVIEAYHALFFDVADKREAKSRWPYVAIDLGADDEFRAPELPASWKLLASVGCLRALELMAEAHPAADVVLGTDGIAVAPEE